MPTDHPEDAWIFELAYDPLLQELRARGLPTEGRYFSLTDRLLRHERRVRAGQEDSYPVENMSSEEHLDLPPGVDTRPDSPTGPGDLERWGGPYHPRRDTEPRDLRGGARPLPHTTL